MDVGIQEMWIGQPWSCLILAGMGTNKDMGNGDISWGYNGIAMGKTFSTVGFIPSL